MLSLEYLFEIVPNPWLYTVFTIVLTYLIIKILHRAIDEIAKTAGATKHIRLTPKQTTHYARPIKIGVNLVAFIIVILMLLNFFGLEGSFLGVLSAAGFMGIVIGFAAKDVLGNLMAGFMIFFDQPFLLGDWIQVGEIEGIVIDTKITSTRIKTFGGEMVAIPNSLIQSEKIINKTHNGKLRVRADVSIDYNADLEKAVKLAKDYMKKSPLFLQDPEPSVLLDELGDSAVKLTLRAWVDPNKQSAIAAKDVLLTNVKLIFEKNKIKIPFPQVELSNRK
ncbi:MAG: mechanosensitive ion channel family protein [archaeon]